MKDLRIQTYVEDIDGYFGRDVIPKTITYRDIISAADESVYSRTWFQNDDNTATISGYYVAWTSGNQPAHGQTWDSEGFDFSGLKLYRIHWMANELTARCSFEENESSSESGSESDSE